MTIASTTIVTSTSRKTTTRKFTTTYISTKSTELTSETATLPITDSNAFGLKKEDFVLTNVTSNSVTVRWNSRTLKANQVDCLFFAAAPFDPKAEAARAKTLILLSRVEAETLTIGPLKLFLRYHLTVRKCNKIAVVDTRSIGKCANFDKFMF